MELEKVKSSRYSVRQNMNITSSECLFTRGCVKVAFQLAVRASTTEFFLLMHPTENYAWIIYLLIFS
jgi:hypothetical protein